MPAAGYTRFFKKWDVRGDRISMKTAFRLDNFQASIRA